LYFTCAIDRLRHTVGKKPRATQEIAMNASISPHGNPLRVAKREFIAAPSFSRTGESIFLTLRSFALLWRLAGICLHVYIHIEAVLVLHGA
jgi:hypothetical protein